MTIHSILNRPGFPVLLAPLAGVSDYPFRYMCQSLGAKLTYVEMLSGTALIYNSKRTLDMLFRHGDEERVGVQVTARSPEDLAKGVEILDKYSFETIDVNMGCPVQKIVKAGCGSAYLKDPERVFRAVSLARNATSRPLSVKIRLGWDHEHLSVFEVTQAIEAAKADWVTIHGRFRSDDYGNEVQLGILAEVKKTLRIPMIGNGNLFNRSDVDWMQHTTACDGVMVSRGSLGNPWIFKEIADPGFRLSVEDWVTGVCEHLRRQKETYGDQASSAICMRKHLLWYTKGWPAGKDVRLAINQMESLDQGLGLITGFGEQLIAKGVLYRVPTQNALQKQQGSWDPKFEMDRQLDRGVGADG